MRLGFGGQRLHETGLLAVEKLPLQIVQALVPATAAAAAASRGVAVAVGICYRARAVPETT